MIYIVRVLILQKDDKRKHSSSLLKGAAAEHDDELRQLQSKLDETARELVRYTHSVDQLYTLFLSWHTMQYVCICVQNEKLQAFLTQKRISLQ